MIAILFTPLSLKCLIKTQLVNYCRNIVLHFTLKESLLKFIFSMLIFPFRIWNLLHNKFSPILNLLHLKKFKVLDLLLKFCSKSRSIQSLCGISVWVSSWSRSACLLLLNSVGVALLFILCRSMYDIRS